MMNEPQRSRKRRAQGGDSLQSNRSNIDQQLSSSYLNNKNKQNAFSMSLARNNSNKKRKFEDKKRNEDDTLAKTISLPACIESDINPVITKKNHSSSSSSSSTSISSSTGIEESPIIKRYREHQHRCFGCSHIGSSLPLIEDEALENLIFLFYNVKNTNINIHCENIHQFYENNIRSKYLKEENGVQYYLLPEWTSEMIKEHLCHHQSDPTIHIQIIMQKLTSSIYHIFATSLHTKKKVYLDNDNIEQQSTNTTNDKKLINEGENQTTAIRNNNTSSFVDQYCPFDEDFGGGDGVEEGEHNNIRERTISSDDDDDDVDNDEDEEEGGVNIQKDKERQLNEDEEGEENLLNEDDEEEDEASKKTNEETFSGVVDYNHELMGEEFDRLSKRKRKYIIKYDVNMNNYKILDNMIKTYLILGKSNPDETMKKFTSNETLDRLQEKKITTHPFFESTTKTLKPSNSLKTTSTQHQIKSSTLTSQAINYCY